MSDDSQLDKNKKDLNELSLGGFGELDPDNDESEVVDQSEDSSSDSNDS